MLIRDEIVEEEEEEPDDDEPVDEAEQIATFYDASKSNSRQDETVPIMIGAES